MLKFRFSGADGVMIESETLTSGMTGKIVKLEFTSDWENLKKTAVFTAGPTTKDVLNIGDEVVIPHEVLQNYGDRLYVGIFGVADDGNVTPTIYARGPRIAKGADPSGDPSTDPTLPVWAQLEDEIDDLSGRNLDLTFHEGKLYITVNGVRTGNGVAIGAAETVYHNIVLNLTNCVSSNDAVQVEEHGEYTTVISAKAGYIMNLLTVTMGGESLTPENGTIHIEDVTGEIQITASAIANDGGVDLSGIVAWYQTEVQDAYNHVAAMDTDEWVHHVVLADTHYGYSQYGNSMEIVTALMNTGRFDKFIHLGDIVDTLTDTQWQSVIEDGYENHNGNMLFVYGNHDDIVSSDTLTTGVYKTVLLSKGNFTWFDGAEYCYYYDDTDRKIRYFCLNTWGGADACNAIVSWVNGLLAEMTSDWSVFILSHRFKNVSESALCNGLVFSNVNVGGIVDGHFHADRHFKAYNVDQTRLLCDRGSDPGADGDDTGFAPTGEQRVQDTNFEQAITIMSINPTERKVAFYRIGAYADIYADTAPKIMEYSYDPGNASYWYDGRWTIEGNTAPADQEDYKYEQQFRQLKANVPLYIYCSSGENTMTDLLTASFNTKNVSDFNARINEVVMDSDGDYPKSLAGTFAYLLSATDKIVSISCNGWSTGEYAVTENPDDIGIFTDKPTMWHPGYISSSGGPEAPDTDTVAYSNIIKVKPNTTYSLNKPTDTSAWCGIGMYKTPTVAGFIKRVSTATFTTTADCNYVILSAGGVLGNEDAITFEEVTE